jgi:hypothetical protein
MATENAARLLPYMGLLVRYVGLPSRMTSLGLLGAGVI